MIPRFKIYFYGRQVRVKFYDRIDRESVLETWLGIHLQRFVGRPFNMKVISELNDRGREFLNTLVNYRALVPSMTGWCLDLKGFERIASKWDTGGP